MSEKQSSALVPFDFSKEAVSKAVLRGAVENPLVTLPSAAGAVGLVASVALGWPLWLAAPLLVGPAVFAINYFGRYDESAHAYLEAIRHAQRQFVAEMPARLRSDLKAAGSEKGLSQLAQLEAQFNDFQSLLERKFSRNGMTLNRFLGTAEQVRAGALYQLQMITDQLHAIKSIPADLGSQSRGRAQNDEQARLMAERVRYRQEVLETVERLHTHVEESLTRLSEISIRIAGVGMGEDEGMKFESYLDELKTLASQASSFHKET